MWEVFAKTPGFGYIPVLKFLSANSVPPAEALCDARLLRSMRSKTVSFAPLMLYRKPRPLFFAALAMMTLTAHTPALAQNLKSGDVTVLASYYEIRGSDCLALRAPRVVITQNPTLGKASIVQTRGQSSDSGRCAYKAVPVSQVVYAADQPGADTLAWEVKYQNKTLGTRRYSATIGVAPAR